MRISITIRLWAVLFSSCAPVLLSAQVIEYTSGLEVGNVSGANKNVLHLRGTISVGMDSLRTEIAFEPESRRVVRLGGEDIFRDTGRVSLSVSLDEAQEYWTYAGEAENPGGYTIVMNLMLPHRRWTSPSLIWIKEASPVGGRYSAARPQVRRESFQITETEMDQWVFIRDGTRLLSVRFTSSNPVGALVSKFMVEPDTLISEVVLESKADFLSVTRLILLPK